MNLQTIKLSEIVANPNQPRKHFDEQALQELSESIKSDGLMSPITIRPLNGKYEIVQGERRYRASKLAGLSEIQAFVQEMSDEDAFHLSVIENIQREQMTPIEEANAFMRYVEMGFTHEQIAQKVSKSRTYVTSRMRLLQLIPEIQDMIAVGKISEGHAKQLLKLRNDLPGKQDNEKPYNYAQKLFVTEYGGKEKVSVKDVTEFGNALRQGLIMSIVHVFKELTDEHPVTHDVVSELDISIEDLTREHLEFSASYEIEAAEKDGKSLTMQEKSKIYTKYGHLEELIFNYEGDLGELWIEKYLNGSTKNMRKSMEKVEEAKRNIVNVYKEASEMEGKESGKKMLLDEARRIEEMDIFEFMDESMEKEKVSHDTIG